MSSLPDQLDEAIIYIKELQTRVEKLKDKKESLLEPESLNTASPVSRSSKTAILSPEIMIHELGSILDVILIMNNVGCNQLIFNKVVRVLQEEGAEILNANFSVIGDVVFHSIHAEVDKESAGNCKGAAATISKRLKKFLHDS
ncbi:hypothetical protein CDL15_Pgr016846 [Punica granatum]|nr:hypothetical protein CDL15_Pgr016846 [Punica granatum]PKI51230.1 hypothetical protein CRG98_028378 [Punica granatum]